MTWRERIQAARERGFFTHEDAVLWSRCSTCLIGETVRALWGEYDPAPWTRINNTFLPGKTSADAQHAIITAMDHRDFDAVERMLDAIEDRALQIKREALPVAPVQILGPGAP